MTCKPILTSLSRLLTYKRLILAGVANVSRLVSVTDFNVSRPSLPNAVISGTVLSESVILE